MKSIFTFLTSISLFGFNAKSQELFDMYIEPVTISNTPVVHSYCWEQISDNKWVINGEHKNHFDWSNIPAGEYFLQITNGVETTQKELIIK